MASDAHAHPWDLLQQLPGAEEERRRSGVFCAASAWNGEQFAYHEELARRAKVDGAAPLALCFAVHPQLPASYSGVSLPDLLGLLETLAGEGRLHAVGETGFDLYNETYRSTEAVQDEIFACHLETALRRDLPLVLHVRRAMHKVFAHAKALRRISAVVFHSYPGTTEEGEALLRRGINAYFSFGAAITLNHKEAARACALLPADRLLTETDAPYQPYRDFPFSRWTDIPATLRAMAELRRAAGSSPLAGPEGATDPEAAIDRNWRGVFKV